MATEQQKQQLLDEFKTFLDEQPVLDNMTDRSPDLYQLLQEMVELKTEVRAESRLFKKTLDSLLSSQEAIQSANEQLARQHQEMEQALQQQHSALQKTWLLEWAEIYERSLEALAILTQYQPVKGFLKKSRAKDIKLIQRLHQGQEMMLERVENLFAKYQLEEIKCLNSSFNPEEMNAVIMESHSRLKNGQVLQVLRKGYRYQGEVVRMAEVKVNKIVESKYE